MFPKLTEINDYENALAAFAPTRLWELFDGNREYMNLAHECLDRHRHQGTAVSVKFEDGHLEHYEFGELADLTSQFAHWLERRGVPPGARIAVILEPGRAFYTCLFGAIKRGAIAVPMFTLFGPDGLALRIHDCTPTIVLTTDNAMALRVQFPALEIITIDEAFWADLARESKTYVPTTTANDLAVFQYTSGTTRELPEAVKHTQRSVVTVMIAALYGIGLRPGDRYFCPSSPAWGHGLWHGTISPLALGIHTATYAGRFDPVRIYEALETLRIDNLAAAATVYRMLRNADIHAKYDVNLRKCTFTGEPLDTETFDWIKCAFGVVPGSMYGTTEVGVVLVDFPGMRGHHVKRGALGKPAPGNEIAVLTPEGEIAAVDAIGEIAVKRAGDWFRVKDFGRRDAEGYFYHAGRADDVIISAGWTMSAVEIENTLLSHPAIAEAAVIGIPDPVRGQIAKAFVVARQGQTIDIAALQAHLKMRLSKHEYPRAVAIVAELPKTPAGKINRKILRDRENLPATSSKEPVTPP